METFLALAGFLIIAIKAITPIITTAIAEKEKTKRARLESGSTQSNALSEKTASMNRLSTASSASRPRSDSLIGFVSVGLGLLQLALVQFGPGRSAALSSGDAAALVESLVLLGMGAWLLAK